MRHVMSPRDKARIRYRLYEAALDSGINSQSYHSIVTEGFLDKLFDKLAGKFGSDETKALMKDKEVSKAIGTAGEDLKKTIMNLFSVSAKRGVPPDQTKAWIKSFVDAIQQKAAASAAPAEGDKSSAGGGNAEEGTPVPRTNPERIAQQPASSNPTGQTAAAMVSALAGGPPPEKAVDKVQEKDATTGDVFKSLYKSIADGSDESEDDVKKVVDALFAAGKLKPQFTIGDSHQRQGNVLVERWQKMAGIRLIQELDASSSASSDDSNGNMGDASEVKIDPGILKLIVNQTKVKEANVKNILSLIYKKLGKVVKIG